MILVYCNQPRMSRCLFHHAQSTMVDTLLEAAVGSDCSDWRDKVHRLVRAPHWKRPHYNESLVDLLRLTQNLKAHQLKHGAGLKKHLGSYPYGYERYVCCPCHCELYSSFHVECNGVLTTLTTYWSCLLLHCQTCGLDHCRKVLTPAKSCLVSTKQFLWRACCASLNIEVS